MKLDQIDIGILKHIQNDSRITIKELAAALNVSTTPIFERLKKLEKRGIIDKYVALLNPVRIGKKLKAFVHISVIDHSIRSIEEFVNQIKPYPEVMECHHLTGDSDFLLIVHTRDIEEYNQFIIEKLSVVGNIGRVKSSFSLSERKKTTAFNLENGNSDGF